MGKIKKEQKNIWKSQMYMIILNIPEEVWLMKILNCCGVVKDTNCGLQIEMLYITERFFSPELPDYKMVKCFFTISLQSAKK